MKSKIAVETEETFRKVLFDVLKYNSEAFESDFQAFANSDELLAACARATDVAALSIVQAYQGRPSEVQLSDLAERVSSFHSGWSGISADQFQTYLLGLRQGTPVQELNLPLEVGLRIPFVVCGHLMLEFADPGKHTQWYDYLDELWEQMEERP